MRVWVDAKETGASAGSEDLQEVLGLRPPNVTQYLFVLSNNHYRYNQAGLESNDSSTYTVLPIFLVNGEEKPLDTEYGQKTSSVLVLLFGYLPFLSIYSRHGVTGKLQK